MRTAPAIRQHQTLPTLKDLVALLGVSLDAWRLRQINAGLQRAIARDDAPAVARCITTAAGRGADLARIMDQSGYSDPRTVV
ncbi:hypothetical protein [Methylobacterium sp. WL69]|uniref:hypothetical protein n=1 Tax=Methylobacterium sp. WL69 TaxID=2603893 RepID=UPI001FED4455|nr:hypothetical protein [Methylobacterium sp. WL69]